MGINAEAPLKTGVSFGLKQSFQRSRFKECCESR